VLKRRCVRTAIVPVTVFSCRSSSQLFSPNAKARMHNNFSKQRKNITACPAQKWNIKEQVRKAKGSRAAFLPCRVITPNAPYSRRRGSLLSGRRQTRDRLPYCARCAVGYASRRAADVKVAWSCTTQHELVARCGLHEGVRRAL
jgi:hypothetical protein